jgi:hypothetical protein
MKSIKTLIIIVLATILSALNVRAQVDDLSAKGVGIALKTSTNGIGGDVVFNFHPRMNVRLGYEKLHLKTDFTFTEEKVDYDATANYNAGSLSLLLDYYLSNHFFLSAGAGWNMFHGTVDGKAASALQYGDIQIPKEKIGTFDFQIDPSLKISPYFGIGFGRTLGLKKKVAFAFEIGGYYQGSPDLTVASTGLLSPTSNPDQQHEARLEKQISQYSVYPVLKFSLSYKIAKF